MLQIFTIESELSHPASHVTFNQDLKCPTFRLKKTRSSARLFAKRSDKKSVKTESVTLRQIVRDVCSEEAVSDLAVLRTEMQDKNEEVIVRSDPFGDILFRAQPLTTSWRYLARDPHQPSNSSVLSTLLPKFPQHTLTSYLAACPPFYYPLLPDTTYLLYTIFAV